jgi:hypothetical protein
MVGKRGEKRGGPHRRLIYIPERLQEIQQETERSRAERTAIRATSDRRKARDEA